MRALYALVALGCLTACQTWTESDPAARRAATSTTSIPSNTTVAPSPTTSTFLAAPPVSPTTAVVTTTTAVPGIAGLVGPTGQLIVVTYDDTSIVLPLSTTNRASQGAIVGADGTVTMFPAAIGSVAQTARVGDSLLIESSGHRIDRYSLADRTWSQVAITLPSTVRTHLVAVGDWAVLTSHNAGPDGQMSDVRVDRIAADGTVVSGTPPEDPLALPVAGSLTVVSDSEIVVYGQDTAHLPDVGLRQPASYNPARDQWRMLSNPSWSVCTKPCIWYSPHDSVYYEAAAWAGNVAYVHTKFGSTDLYALHDVRADRWQQLVRPPVDIESPWIEATPGRVTVFSTVAAYQQQGYGKAAMLDIGTRTWIVKTFGPAATDVVDQRLCPVRVQQFTYIEACAGAAPFPAARLDRSTAAWTAATPEDQAQVAAQRSPRAAAAVLAAVKQ
jgi:hypothetical protein